jgi:hypothetical protein
MPDGFWSNVAVPIVPSDTVNLADPGGREQWPVGIKVGGAGVVQAVLQNNQVVAVTVAVAEILPLRVKRINASGTTATALTALYQV